MIFKFIMDQICRICLRDSISLHLDSSLINKIECIASIQLLEDDNFPTKICEECVKSINDFFEFRQVIINSEKELRKRYDALLSNAKTVIKTDCINHVEQNPIQQKVGSNSKRKRCNICDQSFTTRVALNSHKKAQHIKFGVCYICGITVRADNLKRHINVHQDQPVQCNECGKLFKNSESLRGHMYQHIGNTFKCEFCTRMFKAKNEYHRHLKAHIDPSYKSVCTVCGKRVSHLKRHMYSHTGERPYLCNYCKRGFSSSGALKVHIRQHTKEKPFICEICPQGFPQKVSLLTHLKTKHKKTSK